MSQCICHTTKLTLSLNELEGHWSRKSRVNNILEFLNKHIAGGFMRNKPGWIDYK